jgi:hypothetical protein
MSSVGLIANRNSSTDRYAHCHNKSSPDSVSFSATESKIVSILAKNQTSSTLINGDVSGNLAEYNISAVSNVDANEILPVCYPPELIEQDAVLASVFKNNLVSYDSVSTKLSSKPSSNNNQVLLSVDNTTTSIYDTVAKFETTIESNLMSLDESVEVVFDVSGVDVSGSVIATQYAVNSQYNTKLGIFDMSGANVYPTHIQEHSIYNATKACGRHFTQYISAIDASSGEPIWSDYDDDVTPLTDKFIVTPIDVSNNFDLDKDFGIFKVAIELNDTPITTSLLSGSSLSNNDLISVTLVENATPNNPINADTYIKSLPLFHETNSLSLSNQTKQINDSSLNDTSKFLLPSKNLTINELATLDENPANICVPNFSFKIEVDTSANSGYNFNDVSYNLASFDDSELKDSLIYMKDWVNHPHSLTLSSGHLSLDLSTNGIQSVINNGIVFHGEREKLSSVEAGHDGIIMINSNNIRDRAQVTSSSNANMNINVYYENDTIPTGLQKIDDALCVEPNVSLGWQKVIEKTEKSSTHFKKDNRTTLNLFANGTNVNSIFSSSADSNFVYEFYPTNLINSTNDIEIWKIKSGINLLSQQNKFIDSTGNDIDTIETSVQLTNATPTFNNTVRELRQYIASKTNTDLELNNVLTQNGWSSSLSGNVSFLLTDTDSAYVNAARLPSYEEDLHKEFLKQSNTNTLPYRIQYFTNTNVSSKSTLGDTCRFSYNYNELPDVTFSKTGVSVPNTSMSFSIPSTARQTPVSIVETVVFPIDFSFVNPTNPQVTLTPEKHRLIKVEETLPTYTSTFNIPFGQYTNLNITTPLIQPILTYYVIREIDNSGNYVPNWQLSDNNLSGRVTRRAGGHADFYTRYHRVIRPFVNGHNLSIADNLAKNDLKEFLVYTQSKNMDTQEWTNISNGTHGSIVYAIRDEPIVNDIYDNLLGGSNNIETIMYHNNVNGEEFYVNRPYFTIPLVMDSRSTEFTLETFTTSIDNNSLFANTNLRTTQSNVNSNISSKVLNNDHLYSIIKQDKWNTNNTDYKIISSIDDNDVTVKLVRVDNESYELFKIEIKDNYIFVGDFVVSNINKDVIRKIQSIGSNYSETFAILEDNDTSFNLANGIQVNKVVSNENITNGAYQLFNLKKDNLAHNLVGNTVSSTQPINALAPYQWSSDEYYSDVFSLTKYRGYGHPNTTTSDSVNQYYTVNRPEINATFSINDTSNSRSLSQTFNNIYSDAVFTLNQLKRNINDQYPSDIGLKIVFDYSMPNVSESRNKSIDIVGDTVTIKLENPAQVAENHYLNPNSFPINKTLKDYSLFTFDGSSAYRYSDGPMRIRSSRVKLMSNNADNNFADNSMVYDITWVYNEEEIIMRTFKADLSNNNTNVLQYLGNPESVGSVQGSTWRLMNEYTLTQSREIGTNIGVHNIKFKNDVNVENVTTYYVSSNPYYKYETMGIGNNITLPYNYLAGDFSNNKVVKYVPHITSLKDENGYFTPFRSVTYRDMINNDCVVNVDTQNNLVNNMKFKIKPSYVRTEKELCYNSNNDIKHIAFFGSKIKIDLYKNDELIKNVYDDYITSLIDNSSNNITLVPSQVNSGIKFMIRQPISLIGYSENETDVEYADFYNTTDKNRWFPFKFTLNNVNIFNSNVMELDLLAGPGSYPILYTVKDIVSTSGTEKLCRRIYKYEDSQAMDFDSVASKTKVTFSSRKYVDIEVPDLSLNTGFGRNKFNEILESLTIPNTLSWVNDSTFTDTATYTLLYGKTSVADKFRRNCFYANHNETVFTLINYAPLMVMNNQIGMPLYSVQWNGFVKAPQIAYESSLVAPQRNSYLITTETTLSDLAKNSALKL